MTVFDLRRVRVRSGEEHREAVDVSIAPIELGGERYVAVPEHVPAELSVTRASTGLVLGLRLSVRLHGPCMRCLTDAALDETLALREYQATSPESDELTTPYLLDDRLDLSAWARDALILALPDKILCRPDCAGLCPSCGRDLNAEPHTHEADEGDPRWAALEQLKEKLNR
ncbi:MAG TPA: YceD family protein [Gaiellaceae bacterium]|nr:YceD family protein [Gaiellaceae bacterium]